MPLVPGLLVWAWAVSRWKFVLRNYRECRGRVESASCHRGIWELRFSFEVEPVDGHGSAHVLGVPGVRAPKPGESVAVLVSGRDPRRTLLRAFFE